MVRLSKLADYGLVVMACIARRRGDLPLRTARDIAKESRLPLPTVSRLLKALLHGGLLESRRGNHGGYSLAAEPRCISLWQIIAALEGPVALTECSTGVSGMCDLEECCSIRENQMLISRTVRRVFEGITLADLARPVGLTTIEGVTAGHAPAMSISSGRTL